MRLEESDRSKNELLEQRKTVMLVHDIHGSLQAIRSSAEPALGTKDLAKRNHYTETIQIA